MSLNRLFWLTYSPKYIQFQLTIEQAANRSKLLLHKPNTKCLYERVYFCGGLGLDASTARIHFTCKRTDTNIIWAFQSVCLQTALTWSNQGLSTDSCDTAAHVYSSDFCDYHAVPLLPSFRRNVGRAGFPSCRCLRSLAGILDQWGRLDGHRALLQAESLQGLRGGRGRHLLATDGQILDLILREVERLEIIDTRRFTKWARAVLITK